MANNEAFEVLLEEIEVVANELNEEGAKAFRAGSYDKIRSAIEEVYRPAKFRERIKGLLGHCMYSLRVRCGTMMKLWWIIFAFPGRTWASLRSLSSAPAAPG